jgi:dienelactone hydrolase
MNASGVICIVTLACAAASENAEDNVASRCRSAVRAVPAGRWHPWAGNPILTPGPAGSWDAGALGSMTVLRVRNLFHNHVEDDHVVRDRASGRYYMFYWDRKHEPMGLFRAESPNETDFDFAHAEPIRINGLKYPAMYKFTHVIQDGGIWFMFFAEFVRPGCKGCHTGYATSSDGLHWTAQNTDLLVGQDAEVLRVADDLWLLYYGPDGYFDQARCDIRLAVFRGRLQYQALVRPVTGFAPGAAFSPADSLHGLRDGKVFRSCDELWAGYDPQVEPLEAQVVKEWTDDDVTCRCVIFTIGTFRGQKSRLAAFYAFGRQAARAPGLLQIHGGGQAASLDAVITEARRGYAALSINWGGNRLDFGRSHATYDGPQTDWGALDATHPPQRNKVNHFIVGSLAPDQYTLDPVESPRNSNWFLVLIAARRSLTFLQQQPEVDPHCIGVDGHSMGGKLTADLAGIDQRVKAAVPSCGGAGDVSEDLADLPGCRKSRLPVLELACVSDNAYIPRITCPLLWLSPTNDFNAPVDNMAWNWRNLPDEQVRFSISPHLNHRHTAEHELSQHLWFEQHLKNAFRMPKTPELAVQLRTADGVPAVTVTPDHSLPVRQVDVYYSLDPHALTRFWRDAKAVRSDTKWQAVCPVISVDRPIFVYADVIYELPVPYRVVEGRGGPEKHEVFAISSRVCSAGPAQLRASGVRATDRADRLIDDGARGWHDWYTLNWGHPPLWSATTRKLTDPKWRGPDGARLEFEIRTPIDNTLVATVHCNQWSAIQPGKPAIDYAVAKELKGSADWQTVSIGLSDLAATDLKIVQPLADWRSVTEFTISPSGQIVRNGRRAQVDGKPWQGPREIRNLRWNIVSIP